MEHRAWQDELLCPVFCCTEDGYMPSIEFIRAAFASKYNRRAED